MANVYLICPDGSNFGVSSGSSTWVYCESGGDAWLYPTEQELSDYLLGAESPLSEDASIYNMLFEPQLTTEDYLTLYAAIALYFATCWCFNVIGKQINPR